MGQQDEQTRDKARLTELLDAVRDEIDNCFNTGYSADNLGTLALALQEAQKVALRIRQRLL